MNPSPCFASGEQPLYSIVPHGHAVSRRRIKWIALGSTASVILLVLLIAPVQAGRALKNGYHSLPEGFTGLVPDGLEGSLGRGVDAVSTFFTFGNPHQIVKLDLRLEYSSVPVGGWGAAHNLVLAWSDLGHGIEYEVTVGHAARGGVDVRIGRFAASNATLALPGDGDWYVRVRPFTGPDGGRTTTFGPFRIDSTPPAAPRLAAIVPPKAYTYSFSWSAVTDDSGIRGYQVERQGPSDAWLVAGRVTGLTFTEDQIGNGAYNYRVRAINGAGLLGAASNASPVTVKAPMSNPGRGAFEYGIHANYTSFVQVWDISDPGLYATIDKVPPAIASEYLGAGFGFEVQNQTLVGVAKGVVGAEKNTMTIAEKLFVWLYDYADYDTEKLAGAESGATARNECGLDPSQLQPAGCTYDRKKGICGDLATLYITMLRIAGVPARPVHGYLDNELGSVRIGDFHVWVEVWVRGDPADPRDDWMTVDVSGITGPFDVKYLMVYFGIFNPEYLALGTAADYTDSSWNAWAQFSWTKSAGTETDFMAEGRPVEYESESKNLYFDQVSKKREFVRPGDRPSSPIFRHYFEDVTVLSKKRIDYGVNVQGDNPIRATIRVRFPEADAYANTLPWQSVIYTIYHASPTVDKSFKSGPMQVWEDDFK